MSKRLVSFFHSRCYFSQYKLCGYMRTGSLEKMRQRTVGSRVNAHLDHLFLAFENNEIQVDPYYSIFHIAQGL